MNMQDTQELLGHHPILGFIVSVSLYISTHLLTINLYDLHIPHLIVEIIDVIGKTAIAITAILTLKGWLKKHKK